MEAWPESLWWWCWLVPYWADATVSLGGPACFFLRNDPVGLGGMEGTTSDPQLPELDEDDMLEHLWTEARLTARAMLEGLPYTMEDDGPSPLAPLHSCCRALWRQLTAAGPLH